MIQMIQMILMFPAGLQPQAMDSQNAEEASRQKSWEQ